MVFCSKESRALLWLSIQSFVELWTNRPTDIPASIAALDEKIANKRNLSKGISFVLTFWMDEWIRILNLKVGNITSLRTYFKLELLTRHFVIKFPLNYIFHLKQKLGKLKIKGGRNQIPTSGVYYHCFRKNLWNYCNFTYLEHLSFVILYFEEISITKYLRIFSYLQVSFMCFKDGRFDNLPFKDKSFSNFCILPWLFGVASGF